MLHGGTLAGRFVLTAGLGGRILEKVRRHETIYKQAGAVIFGSQGRMSMSHMAWQAAVKTSRS